MRPNAPHNPAIKSVEDLPDMGTLEILAPAPQHRVESLNQRIGLERHTPLGEASHPIHEPLDRFPARILMGSLALRPALLLFANSRPRVATAPLPQLPGRTDNSPDGTSTR